MPTRECKREYLQLPNGVSDFRVLKTIGHGASSTIRVVTVKSDVFKDVPSPSPTLRGPSNNDIMCTGANPPSCELGKTHCLLALKEIYTSAADSSAVHKRRLAEKEFMVKETLDPIPGIAHLKGFHLEATVVDDTLHLLMDLVDGAPLHTYVRRNNGLSTDRVKHYTADLARILGQLHRRGYVYRDLKASNVMLNRQTRRVVLIDFGFIEKLSDSGGRGTEYGGTVHAMAPEMHDIGVKSQDAVGEVSYGFAVDWWSLGILAYEMLFNKPPFGYKDFGHHPSQTIAELARRSPQSLVFPESLAELCEGQHIESFICQLLNPSEQGRLGTEDDLEGIRRHPWFQEFDWDAIEDPNCQGPEWPKEDEKLGVNLTDIVLRQRLTTFENLPDGEETSSSDSARSVECKK